MEGRKEKNSMVWNRGEFLFCIIVLWTAAIFQGYAVYQEWREETESVSSYDSSGIFDKVFHLKEEIV